MKSSALPFILAGAVTIVTGVAFYRILNAPVVHPGKVSGDNTKLVEQDDKAHSVGAIHNTLEPSEPIASFQLTDCEGVAFDSSVYDDKVKIVNFFFTMCPSTCLKLSQSLAIFHRDPKLADVPIMSITCDPQTDVPDKLKSYAKKLRADIDRWKFLTGQMIHIKQVGMSVGLSVQEKTHASHAVVLDRQNRVRGRFVPTKESDRIEMNRLIIECLKEPVPAPAKVK